jgi:hypothetical protein
MHYEKAPLQKVEAGCAWFVALAGRIFRGDANPS